MTTLSFGPKLSQAEYERRVIELHTGRSPTPGNADDERLLRAELDLTIDHRLGREFPEDRRAALWEVHRRVQGNWFRSALAVLVLTLVGGRPSDHLARRLFNAYARVLTPEELRQLLVLDESAPSAKH